jgi:hypothetical protein
MGPQWGRNPCHTPENRGRNTFKSGQTYFLGTVRFPRLRLAVVHSFPVTV